MCLTPTRAREVLARASHDTDPNTAHRYLTMEEFRCVFSWCVNNHTTFTLHDANKPAMQQAIEQMASAVEQRKPNKRKKISEQKTVQVTFYHNATCQIRRT